MIKPIEVTINTTLFLLLTDEENNTSSRHQYVLIKDDELPLGTDRAKASRIAIKIRSPGEANRPRLSKFTVL